MAQRGPNREPATGIDRGVESPVQAQAVANLGQFQELGERHEHFGAHPVRLDGAARDVVEAQLDEHGLGPLRGNAR